MFSLALAPLLPGVGVSVDYTRASTTRTALQQAADSAALAAAATGSTNNAALTVAARSIFQSNFQVPGLQNVVMSASNAAFLADDSAAVTVSPGTLIAAFIVANTNVTINMTGTLNTSTGAEIAMQKNSQNGQQDLLRLVK